MSAPRRRLMLSALVLLMLAGHLPWLASSLEDLDSFNFALGLHAFDPRAHQPHPPGYPVVIGLGRMALPVVTALGGGPGPGTDARALALVSALSAAMAVVPLFVLFARLDRLGGADEPGGRAALAATALAVTAPLFWFTASRPMSDMPGLALAAAAQALLVCAWADQHSAARARARVERGADRRLAWGALLAAAAIGARSQALWLVAPMLTLALVGRRGHGATRARAVAVAVFGATCLTWLLPLLLASGGVDGYLATLADQAGEDFAGVEMVWTTPSPRVFALALRYVLLDVWGPMPVGVVIVVAALAGLAARLRQGSTALLAGGVLWLPYFVFHLLFQETATSRYDLPLVPPMAWLAAQGFSLLPRLALPWVVACIAVTGVSVTTPALIRYAADGSPISRAMADLIAADERPAIAAHHVFVRAFQADTRLGAPWSSRRGRELLDVTRRWRDGVDGIGAHAPGPLWVLAEPRRTDLALVDPASRVERRRYDWTFDAPRFIRGTRPGAVAWVAMSTPGWFVGDGWALTPELAGLAKRDGAGLARGPLRADVRRRAGAATLVIGGRHLGGAADAAVRVEVRLDDRPLDTIVAGPGPFLRVVPVASGLLDGQGYAELTVHATSVGAAPLPPVAIEQFDLQSAGVPAWGFAEGWHEAEFDRRTGRAFRWTSGSAALRIAGATQDVEVRLAGESPLRYFDRPPAVIVHAGTEVVGRFTPSDDFSWRVRVPASALAASGGVVGIATDQTFRPGDGGGADRRTLGLRLFDVQVAR